MIRVVVLNRNAVKQFIKMYIYIVINAYFAPGVPWKYSPLEEGVETPETLTQLFVPAFLLSELSPSKLEVSTRLLHRNS